MNKLLSRQAKIFKESIVAAGSLFFLSTLFPVNANASRTDFLLDYDCVSTSRVFLERELVDISIAREIHTSLFHISAHSLEEPGNITCRVDPNEIQTLRLKFGREAELEGSRRVSIWLDGNEVRVVNVSPDEVETLLIDVSGVSNIAIEVGCRNCRASLFKPREVRFFEAELEIFD